MVLALRPSHSEPLVTADRGRVRKCTTLSGVAGFLSPTVSKISTVEHNVNTRIDTTYVNT